MIGTKKNFLMLAVLLFSVVFLITGCVDPGLPDLPDDPNDYTTFTAEFAVMDEQGEPIERAHIYNLDFEAMTDSAGKARISGLDSEVGYVFTISKDGYISRSARVTVTNYLIPVMLEKIDDEELEVLQNSLRFTSQKHYDFSDMSYYYLSDIYGDVAWSKPAQGFSQFHCNWVTSDNTRQSLHLTGEASEDTRSLSLWTRRFDTNLDMSSLVACNSLVFFYDSEEESMLIKQFNENAHTHPEITRAVLQRREGDSGVHMTVSIDVMNRRGGVCAVNFMIHNREEDFNYFESISFEDCPREVNVRELVRDVDLEEARLVVFAHTPNHGNFYSAGSGDFYFDASEPPIIINGEVETPLAIKASEISSEERAEELDAIFVEYVK